MVSRLLNFIDFILVKMLACTQTVNGKVDLLALGDRPTAPISHWLRA